jgi:flagellin
MPAPNFERISKMISIQTNVNSLVAQQNLSVNSAFQSKTIAQLTSGYRINQSGDDAAGLAVANQFRSTVAELTQGVANGNDATAQLQIMDGGISNISSILDRLKTLATQSASGTFTGNRATLNSEFQNALSEVDRQAQSIGLNSGGIFAKNLDVYMGTGSGSQTVQNGVVTLGLTNSAVDSQALGMKGMEAVGGTADLGNGNSSVASIVANGVNTSTEAAPGYATFTFSGAGYSDAGKVKVQVNLSSVSDTTSLVSALNNAISGAGSGSPQALAFGRAGIVASVVTDSSGHQHLGFTSSTSAFQVQAGDKMSNALLGNFLNINTSSEGADIKTTVTGATTDLVGNAFAPGAAVTVRIQGSGLAAPVDLTVATGTLVGAAITSLQGQVSSNAQLSAAGVSLSVVANQLVFTSATGESLNVMATGDKTNQLGLGSFTRSSASPTGVDYNTITGATNYAAAGTATNDNATMQISINGAAATNVSVALNSVALGATAATTTTATALTSANIDTLNGKVLTVSVDGIGASTVALTGGTAAAVAGSGGVFAGSTTIVAATTSTVTGTAAITATAWGTTPSTFTVAVNGAAAQTIYLNTTWATTADNAAVLLQINNQLKLAQATISGAGVLTFTASAAGAGAGGGIVVGGTAGALLGTLWTAAAVTGANGNNQLMVSSNAPSSHITPTLVTLTAGTYTGAQMVTQMNAQLFAVGLNDSATPTAGVIASLNGSNLALSASTVGSTAWVTVGAPVLGAATTALVAGATGLSAATSLGTDATAASIEAALQLAITNAVAGTGTNAGATVSLDGSNRLVITNSNAGAGHTTSILSGTAVSVGQLDAGTAHVGTDLTGAQLASALNQQFTTGVLSKAQLTASYAAGALTVSSGNNTNFRVNSGIVNTASITGSGDLSGANAWGVTPASFKISVDGLAFSPDILLTSAAVGTAAALAEIQAAMVLAGISATAAGGAHASLSGNNLVIASNTVGSTASIQVATGTVVDGANALTAFGMGSIKHSADADLGLGVSGSSFTQTLSNIAPKNFVIDSGGASQALTTLTNPPSALAFNALLYGNDSQAITFSANDANGNQQSTTITLKNIVDTITPANTNTSGRNIDQAISFINQQLQASNNATLQKIVAVKQDVNNVDKINFISSLASFNVGVGSTANGAAVTGDGVNAGVSTNLSAGIVGAGANMAVDSMLGAQAAVAALAAAIAQLGAAQAAVGKGQNQLSYAVSLAQSQITNFSAAESVIRDANVAQQAANLSKAQVLTQASIAAMAQANSAPQAVLSLLRG